MQSSNSLKPADPHRVSLGAPDESRVLQPGEYVELPFIIHAETVGKHELCLLFIFREVCSFWLYNTIQMLTNAIWDGRMTPTYSIRQN